ncbi:MAG: glycine cleavage system aminomethyltransferase GcvT [Bacteroidota bacterium]|nr:glycine cleavage system aminomethyltransferase GcvT [Bacteroidota bacterium]
MKRTTFYNIHKQLGAKIVEFAGYEMPIQYNSIINEHMAVRTNVGIFDVSHMGEFVIQGKDALSLVQKVTTNDASKLKEGKVQYSAMCYPDGGIIDDLLVYRMKDHFMVVVNASNLKKDFDWIKSNVNNLDARVINKSDDIALLAIQGPKSLMTLQKLTSVNLSAVSYYSFVVAKLADIDMIISRTGYTGELGFELYFEAVPSIGERIWNAVEEAGREFDIQPIGLAARDTLRLEMGFCLYGNDIDQTTNPLEAGLGWITKFEKGDFIGHEALSKIKGEGIKRKLVGFTINEERAFPRHGYEIRLDGKSIGHVTSGTVSPVLDIGIGMGYVEVSAAQPGNSISILIRNKETKAKVVSMPFIKK